MGGFRAGVLWYECRGVGVQGLGFRAEILNILGKTYIFLNMFRV